jgi:Lon protease-like protein
MCKVVERQLREDGQQSIYLEGVGRFRVNKILKTLPYILAEVEPFLMDAAAEEAEAAKVEKEVFCSLKYYLRLLRSYDKNSTMVVTQATKRNRPGQGLAMVDNSVRRSDFSFSIANMIQMADPKESQLLLQTTDVLKRLRVEQKILSQAAEEVSKQLIKSKVLTVDQREEIRAQSWREDDSDEDIMPAEVVEQEQEQA